MPDDEHKEYIEHPDNRTTDRFIAETDIRDYIDGLAEPIRSVCRGLIVAGQSVREVADLYGVSTKTVLRHVRKALAPKTFTYFEQQGVTVKVISGDNPATVSDVARIAGIRNADKYIDEHKAAAAGTKAGGQAQRPRKRGKRSIFDDFSAGPPGRGSRRSTTGEVVEKFDTLSFFEGRRAKKWK